MIIFNGDIFKGPMDYNAVAHRMRQMLNAKEPRLAQFLYRTWSYQQTVFTYAEIRNALMNGTISQVMIDEWRQDYTKLVDERFMPAWKAAMEAAEQQLAERYPTYLYNPNAAYVRAWTEQRAAELVVDITEQQRTAINDVVQRAARIQDISVDDLARVIRPMVGLYPGQAVANLRYYETVRQNIINTYPQLSNERAEKSAQAAAIKYAGKQHRYRAQMIARTELCAAYNHGELGAVKQAIHEGKMGCTKKRWVTGGDDRVCNKCKALEGITVGVDELYPGGYECPGAHPHCRCVEVFEEVEAPEF